MSAGIPLLSSFESGPDSSSVRLCTGWAGLGTGLSRCVELPQDYAHRPSDRHSNPPTSPLHRLIRSNSPLSVVALCLCLVLLGSGLEAVRSSWAGAGLGARVKLDQSKLAVLLEKRNEPVLAPILIDFIAKVPKPWPFQVWTEPATAEYLSTVAQLQPHLGSGKLTLKLLPNPDEIFDGNSLSAFMAKPWWWEQLAPAEQ